MVNWEQKKTELVFVFSFNKYSTKKCHQLGLKIDKVTVYEMVVVNGPW